MNANSLLMITKYLEESFTVTTYTAPPDSYYADETENAIKSNGVLVDGNTTYLKYNFENKKVYFQLRIYESKVNLYRSDVEWYNDNKFELVVEDIQTYSEFIHYINQ